jgi:hypothetical protein
MESLLISTDALCRKCTRCKTLWLRLPPLSFSYYRLSIAFTRLMCEIRSHLNRGILDRYATVATRPVWQMMRDWEVWNTNIQKSNNHRMLQLAFHVEQTIKATITQDLDPRPLANNDHTSVLPHEMYQGLLSSLIG